VLSGLPRYAFAGLEQMEKEYESMMSGAGTRAGLHLLYSWRETMPSPLPEPAWSTTYSCEYTKKRNDKIRAAFRTCLREGILTGDPANGKMTLKLASGVPEFTSLHGVPTERLRQIDQLRDANWVRGDKLELDALGEYERQGGAFDDDTLARNVEENTLRFYPQCEALLKQADILEAVLDKREGLEAVRDYMRADQTGLIESRADGLQKLLKRAEMDPLPYLLFDGRNDNRSYPDYLMFQRFREVYADRKAELQQAYEYYSNEKLLTSKVKQSEAKQKLEERIRECDGKSRQAASAAMEYPSGTPGRVTHEEIAAFYSDLKAWCEDEEQLLPASAQPAGQPAAGPAAPAVGDDTWDCPNCGEKGIPSKMKFCFSCGTLKTQTAGEVCCRPLHLKAQRQTGSL
jgi:hypothetical protein